MASHKRKLMHSVGCFEFSYCLIDVNLAHSGRGIACQAVCVFVVVSDLISLLTDICNATL